LVTQTTTIKTPTQQTERVVIVDIIRGFALAGVLMANFTAYNLQNLPADLFERISSPLDKAIVNFNTIFIEWKMMTIFSVLFGYGFGLIITSIEKKNINPTSFFLRRMFWLFVFGIIHTLFWWADVLHLYAISGVFLLAFRKTSPRTILISSLVFMFVIPPVISFLFRNHPGYFTNQNMQVLYEHYKNGSIADVFKANVNLYYRAFILSGDDLHDIIETLGRFLFGYYLVQIKLFEFVETKKQVFKKVLLITAPVAIGYFIIRWLSLQGSLNTGNIYGRTFIKLGIIFTSCFYCSLLVLSYIRFGKTLFFSALQALGKMTLTNYLLVSAILITLLYGIGFGQLGILTMQTVWLYAFIWLIVEIIFSSYWLSKFKYGPFEWIWRQLSYNKRIPLRK
jgi:uncharacterized protein